MNPNDADTLPRAIAMQYDRGEVVFAAGSQPVLREYSYSGSGLRVFGKSADFLGDPRFQRAYAAGWSRMGKSAPHTDDARWIAHVAIWAASQAGSGSVWLVQAGKIASVRHIAMTPVQTDPLPPGRLA